MENKLLNEAESIIASIDIPSQPQVILDIYNEVLQKEPDFKKINQLVSMDMAMAARIIKIANSPYFGLCQKVHSIERALMVLGLENFTNIIVTSSMRDLLKASQMSHEEYEAFFEHCMQVARINQFVTHKVRIFSGGLLFPSQTYMSGLFHDCGIIILRQKYPDYMNKIGQALLDGMKLIEAEEAHFQTNHCLVGYVVSRSWKLPDVVCKVIQHHHDVDLQYEQDKTLQTMCKINILTECVISYLKRTETHYTELYGHVLNSAEEFKPILEALYFNSDDFKDVVDTTKDIIMQDEEKNN